MQRDYFTIGEVVDSLKGEFKDISSSKIRFFETEGLIKPERTESGYRRFYEQDIERLRTILRLQRDNFYPLSVIAEKLDSNPLTIAATTNEKIDYAESFSAPIELVSLQEVCEKFKIGVGYLNSLETFGLIKIKHGAAGRDSIDSDYLKVIEACKKLEAYGVEPRHLRIYANLANNESMLFERVLSAQAIKASKSDDETERETFNEMLGELDSLTNLVHKANLHHELKTYFDGIL